MKKRPLPIVIVAFIFFLTGFIAIAYHGKEYLEANPLSYELAWSFFIRMLAIVCGLLLLRGINWARWLALAWLAYHVVLSLFHSAQQVIVHFMFLAIITFLLFMPKSSAYFRNANGHDDRKKY